VKKSVLSYVKDHEKHLAQHAVTHYCI